MTTLSSATCIIIIALLLQLACAFTTVPLASTAIHNSCCQTEPKTFPFLSFLNARQPSKWDNIVDEDDDDVEDGNSSRSKIPVPSDMTYEPRNAQRQHENFVDIRNAGGKDVCNDVYVRNPQEDVFWYAGKVARVSGVSLEDCIARQWNLIETHASNLRPIELFPHRGRLEIWTAPGDSELEVAYNRPDLQMIKHTPKAMTNRDLKQNFVGFQGEIYQKGEAGFRTWRTDEGLPARPEINPGGETRPPTEEEYAQIQKELQGKDINAIYEEQERRKEQGLL
ncbi:hypothetical protein IV203_007898 [Nitzschia inconspicua]|uniref:Uncharacterized protein n=1 Tax=Nitzschia inconspicua TaxID=303405 RepID=A0A9K3PLG4_9STRA|nr:hypothetical protein IV203_007898 [Nitzschia inconspicua]